MSRVLLSMTHKDILQSPIIAKDGNQNKAEIANVDKGKCKSIRPTSLDRFEEPKTDELQINELEEPFDRKNDLLDDKIKNVAEHCDARRLMSVDDPFKSSRCEKKSPKIVFAGYDDNLKKPYVKIGDAFNSNEARSIILEALEGPYKTQGQSMHWESILDISHLLLTLTIFVENLILKFVLMQLLCLTFLIQHLMIKPFKNKKSNNLETLSLVFLLIISQINGLKGCFIYGVILTMGLSAKIFQILSVLENLFLLCLVAFIMVF